jgi:hypothetical protein
MMKERKKESEDGGYDKELMVHSTYQPSSHSLLHFQQHCNLRRGAIKRGGKERKK